MSDNFFDLTGQVAVVTGASRGLGQYFSRALGRAGAKLIVTSRKAGDCDVFLTELAAMGIGPFLLSALGLSLSMLGPGAWSLDARLFGRKQINF